MENSSTNLPGQSSRANKPLLDSFFLQPCLDVARSLLGKGLVRIFRGDRLVVEITEVEAYLGDEDPASHAYRKRTPRNAVMFERGGACYVYLSYGMNFCMNVVAGPEGVGQAVLLRAARPIAGLETMRQNRGLPEDAKPRDLCSGPGKLARALAIDKSHYGHRFNGPDLHLVDLGIRYLPEEITAGPRIGISQAKELPYRFCVKGSPWLSRKA